MQPVFVIGTLRSGKTLLASRLANAGGIAHWSEPNTVWGGIGKSGREHERFTAEAATARKTARIRKQYKTMQKKSGGKRIVDDSPLHCLGLPYAREVFPDAHFIHIFRDGRDVICDMIKSWTNRKKIYPASRRTLRYLALRLRETPVWQWPAYLPRVVCGVMRRFAGDDQSKYFHSIRYPGWRHDFERLTVQEFAAAHWRACQTCLLDDLACAQPKNCIHVPYESFVSNPLETLTGILHFLEEPADETRLRRAVLDLHTDCIGQWQTAFTPDEASGLTELLEPGLSRVRSVRRHCDRSGGLTHTLPPSEFENKEASATNEGM